MSFSKALIFTIVSAAIFAGCSKDEQKTVYVPVVNGGGGSGSTGNGASGQSNAASVDANGNCTQSFVDAYNNVSMSETEVRDAQDEQLLDLALLRLRSACNKFFNVHENAECSALSNLKKQTIKGSSLSEICTDSKRDTFPAEANLINRPQLGVITNTSVVTPNQNRDLLSAGIPLKSVDARQLEIKITNRGVFLSLFASAQTQTLKSTNGNVSCGLIAQSSKIDENELSRLRGHSMKNEEGGEGSQVVSIDIETANPSKTPWVSWSISCVKNTPQPITDLDLNDALNGVIQIVIVD